MVWSDNATVRQGGTPYFSGNSNLAVYTIGTPTANGEKSEAPIEDPAGNGLQYPDENPGTKLWGIYPASAVTESQVDNAVPFKIESEQALAQNSSTKAYAPDMNQAVMVAYVSSAKAGAPVVLPFTPAFTDFEFNLGIPQDEEQAADYSVTITAVEFVSTSTALSGGFTATCGNDGTWTYTFANNAAKSVKATFDGDGITLDKNNPNLTFNVFALPQDLTNLKVTFYTNEGTKTLKLIEKKTSSSDADSYLTFDGGKKHQLNGVILPTGWFFKYITLKFEVLEWEAVTVDGNSSEFPQSTQFAVSGEGVKNGDSDLHLGGTGDNRQKDPYRQQWYFIDGQTVTVFFKIMLPVNGRWELETVGGTEENPAEGDDAYFSFDNAYTSAVETDALSSVIGSDGNTAVKINITYTGPAGEAHAFYFHTCAYDAAGNKYNIDSETQIYDRGRGYHTFFVNNSLYNN